MRDDQKTAKLNKTLVDALSSSDSRFTVWDTELKGFGIRIGPGAKTYLVRYRVGGGRTGTLKQLTIGRHGTLAPDEARKIAKAKLAEVAAGGDPQTSREKKRQEMTISELCDNYLQNGVSTKKASTLYVDRSRIERHIKPLLGGLKITEVTRAVVEKFRDDIAKGTTAVATKPKGKRTRADAPVTGGKGASTRTMGLLGGIFSYAVGRDLVATNPVRGVQRFKGKAAERFLSVEEYGRLGAALEACTADGYNDQALTIIRLLLLTGARKGEIEQLRWSEVDFSSKWLRLGDSKTGAKAIPVGDAVIEILQNRRGNQIEDGWVFPAASGEGYFVGTPRIWNVVRKRAGLPDVRLHDARHGHASLAAADGQPLQVIGAILGHKDVKTTSRYAHLADSPLRQAADRVSGLADAAMRGGK
ncbi:site-specific integrase [Brevundimonas goettingensis]|uniref:Tyrosine-type recombinase/integrase n=1 Tax=Brevundimonas goettingensis TaxID=2774190 RepID=A0A975GXD9_9CAUL|nr:site-specific integrase [Brevundimonas goettingensis]QTC90430.1 tyrosine-type recombinase/integrase [Brevundimonas goettingensis]